MQLFEERDAELDRTEASLAELTASSNLKYVCMDAHADTNLCMYLQGHLPGHAIALQLHQL